MTAFIVCLAVAGTVLLPILAGMKLARAYREQWADEVSANEVALQVWRRSAHDNRVTYYGSKPGLSVRHRIRKAKLLAERRHRISLHGAVHQ